MGGAGRIPLQCHYQAGAAMEGWGGRSWGDSLTVLSPGAVVEWVGGAGGFPGRVNLDSAVQE